MPAAKPLTDEAKQRDPFSLYAACGAVFPEGDGDEYPEPLPRAKPDHVTELRRIFAEDPNPSFDVIDAVGRVKAGLPCKPCCASSSARSLLFALLAPSPQQQQALKSGDSWVTEAKALFQSALGLKVLTRSKTWAPIADELWRYLLYSEFVFDLPEALPAALADVPLRPLAARLLVEDLCDRLRNDLRTQALYIGRAEAVEQELELRPRCHELRDLGIRDTFPFEERTFFAQAVDALQRRQPRQGGTSSRAAQDRSGSTGVKARPSGCSCRRPLT